MYKILIIEDDLGIAEGIKTHLEKWGMQVLIAKNLTNIVEEFNKYQPHLILLDIMLPFYDGYYWCKELREISNVPIIFISSINDNMNIIMAMNMGADDFIVKPFDLNVLTAKINALLRRTYSIKNNKTLLEHKGFSLNLDDQSAYYQNNEISLTKNEFKILSHLLINKGKVVSRESLMEKLWKSDSFVDENTLTVNINRLRKKLESFELTDFIKTKFGVGYIIEA